MRKGAKEGDAKLRAQRQLDFFGVPRSWTAECGVTTKALKQCDHWSVRLRVLDAATRQPRSLVERPVEPPSYPLTGWQPESAAHRHAYRQQVGDELTTVMQQIATGAFNSQAINMTIDCITAIANNVHHNTTGLRSWQQTRPTSEELALSRRIVHASPQKQVAYKAELAHLRQLRRKSLALTRL